VILMFLPAVRWLSNRVGGQHGARDVARLRRGEERDELGDLLWLGGAPQGGRVADRGEQVVRLRTRVHLPGRDGVDPHAGGAVLGGPGASQRSQRHLGSAIGSPAGHADGAGHAADVDDAAVPRADMPGANAATR
jgi:hypothetical protein